MCIENFHNLIKPISSLLKVDKQWGEEVFDFQWPSWFDERNIIFTDGARMFNKYFYKNNELIAEADVWLSTKNLDIYEPIDLSIPLLDSLSEREPVKNIVYEIKYEEANRLGYEMMVIIFFGYDEDSICIAGKFYIKVRTLYIFSSRIFIIIKTKTTCFGFYYFLKIHSKICFLKLVSFPNVRKLGLINEKLLKKLLGLLNDLNPSYPDISPLPELPTPPKGNKYLIKMKWYYW
ncbi:hypothetical protein [Mycoplasmopsis cynos]|uniref:hypothetical protein n=1 Tax=Mycoplasmopsis cynos TaxID=171284 RepID=UPI0025404EC9|nr:hypothetical protein [Mycoplasmopsis cynos]